jgi:hypothetical protein
MNEPLDELLLESLRNDFAEVGSTLKALALRVIEEGVSEYPIFVASQELVSLGKPIFDQDLMQLNWFFSASILEEFVRKQIVEPGKLARFRKAYENPEERACLFVVTPEVMQFVFLPYHEAEAE